MTSSALLLVVFAVALVVTVVLTATASVFAALTSSRLALYLATGGLGLSLLLASVPTGDLGFGVNALVAVGVLIIAVAGGGPASTEVLARSMRGSVRQGAHGGILLGGDSPTEVLRGGKTIGLLERLAVAGTLLAGFPEGLAVIVAVKGVGRFTELDSAEARERFIIGTLVSLTWAAAAAGVAVLARG